MDTFGKQAVEQYAQANGTSPSAVVQEAVMYYLAERDTGRYSWRVPRFARESGQPRRDEELQIDMNDSTWAALEQEALRQGVSTALLTQHAVLYFLAELDSGRYDDA